MQQQNNAHGGGLPPLNRTQVQALSSYSTLLQAYQSAQPLLQALQMNTNSSAQQLSSGAPSIPSQRSLQHQMTAKPTHPNNNNNAGTQQTTHFSFNSPLSSQGPTLNILDIKDYVASAGQGERINQGSGVGRRNSSEGIGTQEINHYTEESGDQRIRMEPVLMDGNNNEDLIHASSSMELLQQHIAQQQLFMEQQEQLLNAKTRGGRSNSNQQRHNSASSENRKQVYSKPTTSAIQNAQQYLQKQQAHNNYNSVQHLMQRQKGPSSLEEEPLIQSQTTHVLMMSARSEEPPHPFVNPTQPHTRLVSGFTDSTPERQYENNTSNNMQERLKYLDNYRVICEKRIKDLAPSHPLPVLPSHCGKPNPYIEELKSRMRMQQNILQESTNSNAGNTLASNVEILKLRTQVETLNQEKLQLENALRNETLANEEQRNYIQILRHAIDQKMESLGILDLIKAKNQQQQNPRFSNRQDDPVTIYTLLSELQRELDSQKRQYKTLEDQAMQADNQLRHEQEVTEALQKQLHNMSSLNQRLKDKVEKMHALQEESKRQYHALEMDRQTVIDKADKLQKLVDKQQQDLLNEKQKLKQHLQEHDSLKFQLIESQTKYQAMSNELIEQKAVVKLQEEQLSLLKDELRQIKRQNTMHVDLEAKNRDLEHTLATQTKSSMEKSQQIDLLRSSIRQLEDQIAKAQSELQQVSEDYALRAKRQAIEEETLKKRLALHEKNARELAEKLRETENKFGEEVTTIRKTGEERVDELVSEKGELTQKVHSLEKSLYLEKRERENLESEVASLQEELGSLKFQNETRHSDLNKLKHTYNVLSEENLTLNQKLQRMEEQSSIDQQRLDWLSQERENLITEFDEVKGKLEIEVVQSENLLRKNQCLEREISEQRNFLSKELNTRTDETIQLMRQIDVLSSDVKQLSAHNLYLESSKSDLETKIVEKQKELDTMSIQKKLLEQQVQEANAENEMLYHSEARIKRLLDDLDEYKSQIRQRDRDIAMLQEQCQKLNDQLALYEREAKVRVLENEENQQRQENEEVVIIQLQKRIKELEEKLLDTILHSKDLEGEIKAGAIRIEQAVKTEDEAKQTAETKDKENKELLGHLQRLRQKQNDQSFSLETLNTQLKDAEVIAKQIMEKATQYLNSFITLLQNSQTINEALPLTFKERVFALQAQDPTNNPPNSNTLQLLDILHYLSSVMHIALELDQTLSSEFLDSSQNLIIAQAKVSRLEAYVGGIQHGSTAISNSFLTHHMQSIGNAFEKDEFTKKLEAVKNENRVLKTEIQDLNSVIQGFENQIKQYESGMERYGGMTEEMHILEEERKVFEGLANRFATFFKQKIGFEQTEDANVMLSLMKCATEKMKCQRLKNAILKKLSEKKLSIAPQPEKPTSLNEFAVDLELVSLENQLKDCEFRLDDYTIQERQLEGKLIHQAQQFIIQNLTRVTDQQKLENTAASSKTIEYLAKESQELREMIQQKTLRIQELESENSQLKSTLNATSNYNTLNLKNEYEQPILNGIPNQPINSPLLSNFNSLTNTFSKQKYGTVQSNFKLLPKVITQPSIENIQSEMSADQQISTYQTMHNIQQQNEENLSSAQQQYQIGGTSEFINIYDYEPERLPVIQATTEEQQCTSQTTDPNTLTSQWAISKFNSALSGIGLPKNKIVSTLNQNSFVSKSSHQNDASSEKNNRSQSRNISNQGPTQNTMSQQSKENMRIQSLGNISSAREGQSETELKPSHRQAQFSHDNLQKPKLHVTQHFRKATLNERLNQA